MKRLLCIAAAAAACSWIAQPAYGGASCEERKIGAEEIRKAMQLGYRTRQIAEGAGASVALVGRVGSDVSEYGLRYTHIGALVRDHPKGRWIFVHVLNECGSSRSDVYNEGLANFYLDDPHDYEGVVVVPSPQYQRRLAEALLGPSARALHEPSYNMIAHPRSEKYQNSVIRFLDRIDNVVLRRVVRPDGPDREPVRY